MVKFDRLKSLVVVSLIVVLLLSGFAITRESRKDKIKKVKEA